MRRMQRSLQPCAKPQATTEVYKDWTGTWSPFRVDREYTHPSNARPTAAWEEWGSSWLEERLTKTHPRARAR